VLTTMKNDYFPAFKRSALYKRLKSGKAAQHDLAKVIRDSNII